MKRNDPEKDERDRQIEREARAGLKFSTEQAMFLSAGGGGLMKGGTPVSPVEQAHHEVMVFLDQHVNDSVLEKALNDWVTSHRRQLEAHLRHPIQGLLAIITHTLDNEGALVEFVRTVDVLYGRMMMERPHFQQPDQSPHPEDAYTFESVRRSLDALAAACRTHLESA